MTERKPEEETWESFVERQIREAQASGEFDNLPGFGKPMPDIDSPHDEMWWLKKKAKQEQLSLLPPSLAIFRDIEKTMEAIYSAPTDDAARALLESLNARIRSANFASAWGPPTTAMPLDADRVLAERRRRLEEDASESR